MLKKYEKPVSTLIRTESMCNFTGASVINGNDQKTPVSYIDVEEETDPNGTSNGSDNSWGSDLWGGD